MSAALVVSGAHLGVAWLEPQAEAFFFSVLFLYFVCYYPTLFCCALHFAIMIGAVIYGLMCNLLLLIVCLSPQYSPLHIWTVN